MAQFPYLPVFTDALLGDTPHLTTAEFGAYLLMLIVAWRDPDCSLPNDDAYLAKITRSSNNWKRIRVSVLPFWNLGDDNRLRQKRLTRERERAAQVSAARSAAAHAKHQRYNEPDAAIAEQMTCKPPASTATVHRPHNLTNLEDEKNGFHGSDARSQIKPTPEERAWRKGRWEQNTMNHIRCTMQAPQAEAVIAGYLNGDPRAVAAFEAASADLKRRKANAPH